MKRLSVLSLAAALALSGCNAAASQTGAAVSAVRKTHLPGLLSRGYTGTVKKRRLRGIIKGVKAMRVLEHLEPARVFYYFEALSAIPHGSRNTKAISDYCVAFAREHGLPCHQDEVTHELGVNGGLECPFVILDPAVS